MNRRDRRMSASLALGVSHVALSAFDGGVPGDSGWNHTPEGIPLLGHDWNVTDIVHDAERRPCEVFERIAHDRDGTVICEYWEKARTGDNDEWVLEHRGTRDKTEVAT